MGDENEKDEMHEVGHGGYHHCVCFLVGNEAKHSNRSVMNWLTWPYL